MVKEMVLHLTPSKRDQFHGGTVKKNIVRSFDRSTTIFHASRSIITCFLHTTHPTQLYTNIKNNTLHITANATQTR